jgi:anaerobic ribonucleoside-triphosphate reductase activating protein
MANIAKIKQWDIANGKGIRTSIFFSGCEFHCKGCFNSEIWDFNTGEQFTREYYETKIRPTINEHISGISILGGEPMHPCNIEATYFLTKWFKEDFPDKTIWLWSGYTYEELISETYSLSLPLESYMCDDNIEILINTDVLVDGQYIEEQRDLTLKWRGSRNQRVINAQESLKQNKIVLYEN